MRAVVCREYGPFENMRLEDVPAPPLPPGHVRIAVHAAGVSFANILNVAGTHQNKPPLPFSTGTEVGGVVTEVAPDVAGVAAGDRVAAAIPWGGYAEEVVAPLGTVYPMPDAMPFEHAVHFTTIYSTTYGALAWLARLQPGETLLVHGAGGATGLAGVEIGRALGARVIATAGSAEKRATACAHGADHAIDYRNEDVRARVLALTGGRGVDVVYDPVGGAVFDASIRCTAPEGRLIPIGFASGTIPQIPANLLLVKNLSVIGCYWGYYLGWGKTRADAARRAEVKTAMATLFDWYVEGRLRPIVDATYDLADFATALRRVADGKVVGKVVLLPGAGAAARFAAQSGQAGRVPA